MKEHVSKGVAVLLVCLGISILIATVVGSVVVVRMSNAELERERRDEKARAQAAYEQAQNAMLKVLEEFPNPEQLCGDRLIQVVKQALESSGGSN